jgi:hypothetical protein
MSLSLDSSYLFFATFGIEGVLSMAVDEVSTLVGSETTGVILQLEHIA